jgi:ATP-dependent RNA helicase DeaD
MSDIQTPVEPAPVDPNAGLLPASPNSLVPSDYIAEESFDQLPLSEAMRRGIADRGYTKPTPVQARALRPALAGKDLIVRSKTGTGKTAAFGIPVLERLDASLKEVQAIALCPTRELAIQVAEEVALLGKAKGIHVTAIYGGASMDKQIAELNGGAQFIVGTPGRVYDHIRRKTLRLGQCRVGVLDEADEMLNQGFFEEVTRILDCLPETRQTLLFSATVTPDIERLIKKFTRDPETILLSGDTYTVEGITNVLYDVTDAYPKPRNLLYLLEKEQPDNAIIFCNTRDDTALVSAVLNRNGFDAELLNGDLPQKERERVMAKVKRGELQFMVATDIAARGIDISDLGHVINYSLPEDPAVYLHRIGRTGRIGKTGVAISLVSGRELGTLSTLEKKFNIKFEKRQLPSAEDAQRVWTDKHLREIRAAAQGAVYDAMIGIARDLKTREDGDVLFAFLLKYFFTKHRMDQVAAREAGHRESRESRGEPPLPVSEGVSARPRERERERERPRERDRDRPPRGERDRDRDRPPRPPRAEAPAAPAAAAPAADATPAHGAPEGVAAEPRPDRPPRPPRAEVPEAPEDPTKTRLWVSVGAADQLDQAALTALLAGFGGDAGQVQQVEVRHTHSYVTVKAEAADAFIALTGKEHAGKALRVERPRKKR